MLITCPECGEKISDKADKCIHCGYPIKVIKNIENTICNIDGTPYDLYEVLNLINNGKYKDSFLKLNESIKISIKNCLNIIEFIDISSTIPDHYETKEYTKNEELEAYKKILSMKDKKLTNNGDVLCPKCGSNQITTGQRGFSLLTGFIGSNKTVNRCGKCGYSWKP